MSTEKQPENHSFEDSMLELENIVKQMEQGELPLEKALEKFERGIQLARLSQTTLKEAEQKVKMLMTQNGQEQLVTLEQENEQ